MKREEYITTIIINNKMINIGFDDYGQTFFLEYEKDGKIIEDCIGAYETDFTGYAEMLFEDPKHCDHFELIGSTCEICDKTYCSRCPLSYLVQARNQRWLEQYGVEYPNLPKKY